jgi:hypothetical protein
MDGVRALRGDLARGVAPSASDLARTLAAMARLHVSFDLLWPWGGEPFEQRDIRPLTYITGPLGSGKTRLAMRIAEEIGGVFLGLDRAADPSLMSKIEPTVALLVQDSATGTPGYEALASCLATPEVRARSGGVIAVRR